MRLGELIRRLDDSIDATAKARDMEVADITNDSRTVKPGSLFVAVRGFHSDGHKFIQQAFDNGAVAVIAEKRHARGAGASGSEGAPVIFMDDTRKALALLSDAFYGHPSGRMKLIGVTGTNGKTTVTYLVKSIIEASGHAAGLIGTIDYRIGDRTYPAPNTTPESVDLQRLLAEMAETGASHCVMEVSSHALALGRTTGCEFAAAAFTNLSQDHLDFHRDMEAYFEAKLLLFTGLSRDSVAVVNLDDPRSERIIRSTRARAITTGMSGRADVHPAGEIGHGIDGLSFVVSAPGGNISIRSSLVGGHNICNILTAVGIAVGLGLDRDSMESGVANMTAIPGRMEKIGLGQGFGVIVDYAHTEDALIRLLEAVEEIAENRIITVFGCGGDRDRTKRPKMGAAAAKASDLVVVTSDNPRTEDPMSIIREIQAGMTDSGVMVPPDAVRGKGSSGKTPYVVMPDRREAVEWAIKAAEPGDVVVIAGKGHEDYQIIGERKIHFDDREAARESIMKMLGVRQNAR